MIKNWYLLHLKLFVLKSSDKKDLYFLPLRVQQTFQISFNFYFQSQLLPEFLQYFSTAIQR
jgi:hypothetical protein